MTGEMEKMLEAWKAQLPAWQRWVFNVLDRLGFYDLGYKIFGFDTWFDKR